MNMPVLNTRTAWDYIKTDEDKRLLLAGLKQEPADETVLEMMFGPWLDRIIDNPEGFARPVKCSDKPTIVFVRGGDGWACGCPP